jgi:transcriptional regulator with XRE-family HTH domain
MAKFLNAKLKECRGRRSVEDFTFELRTAGMDISTHTIRRWESGDTKPNAEQLIFLADYCDKPIAFFFDIKKRTKNV